MSVPEMNDLPPAPLKSAAHRRVAHARADVVQQRLVHLQRHRVVAFGAINHDLGHARCMDCQPHAFS
jgi:hypothetical protein